MASRYTKHPGTAGDSLGHLALVDTGLQSDADPRHYRSLGGTVNQYLAIAWDEIEPMKGQPSRLRSQSLPAHRPKDHARGVCRDH